LGSLHLQQHMPQRRDLQQQPYPRRVATVQLHLRSWIYRSELPDMEPLRREQPMPQRRHLQQQRHSGR
jgi:hypothetical protein